MAGTSSRTSRSIRPSASGEGKSVRQQPFFASNAEPHAVRPSSRLERGQPHVLHAREGFLQAIEMGKDAARDMDVRPAIALQRHRRLRRGESAVHPIVMGSEIRRLVDFFPGAASTGSPCLKMASSTSGVITHFPCFTRSAVRGPYAASVFNCARKSSRLGAALPSKEKGSVQTSARLSAGLSLFQRDHHHRP